MSDEVHLTAKGLKKAYHKGPVRIPVLLGVDLRVARGEFVSIVGASGSGKSTLLHLLGTLDRPDAGQVRLDGRRIDNLPPRQRDRIRNRSVGFVFQFYHLLPELSTLENVLLPAMIDHSWSSFRRSRGELRRRAGEILQQVGLGHRLTHKPSELSGGELQRAAIARSLVNQPEVLLADEPTGNLDADRGREILALLRRLNRERKLTIIMVTHDLGIAERADRTVRLAEGKIERFHGNCNPLETAVA